MNVIVANRLVDGLVVFRTAEGDWSRVIADAARLDGDDLTAAVAAAKADEAAQRVLDPYPIEVAVRDGAVVPKSLKERIRAFGPTVPGALGTSPRPHLA